MSQRDRGIPVVLQGGLVGTGWAARQLTDALAADTDTTRLARGLRYATSGNVTRLQIRPGRLTADVVGSEDYQTVMAFPLLSERDWRLAGEALAARPALIDALASGRMPPETQIVFRDCARNLLPRDMREITTRCSCPDNRAGRSCKHIAAVVYVLADQLSRNPQIVFVLRGMPRDEFLDLAASIAAGAATEFRGEHQRDPAQPSAAQQAALARFWTMQGPLPELPQTPTDMRAGRLLRRHGPLPGAHSHPAVAAVLQDAYDILQSDQNARDGQLTESGDGA